MINLNELRDRAYNCAQDHGFHDKKYSDAHYLMLTITELSEAVEADRKGKRANVSQFKVDKSLEPESLMENLPFIRAFEKNIKDTIEDELADTVIRLLDLAGCLKIDIDLNDKLPKYSKVCFDSFGSFTNIAYKACNWLTNNEFEQEKWVINGAIWFIFSWCEYLNIDIIWHIEQKMKYNELRPKMHGKKY